MSVRVGVGLSVWPFSDARAFWRYVELLEGSGVDSLWQTDRLATAVPYLEALSAMAAIAGATQRLKFGMNAVVVPLRDPLVLARQCATIDFLSGGRLLPVFGVGAESAPEWRATGRSPRGRGGRADEALDIVRRLWSGERVSFEGRHYRYRDAEIAPRPVQQPLPLWIGGHSAAAIRRTARLGTGWLGGLMTPAQVAPVVRAVSAAASRAGRAIDADHYGATFLFRFGSPGDAAVARMTGALARRAGAADPERLIAVGDAGGIAARARAFFEAGAHKFVAIPVAEGEGDVFEQTKRLAEEVVPVVEAFG